MGIVKQFQNRDNVRVSSIRPKISVVRIGNSVCKFKKR